MEQSLFHRDHSPATTPSSAPDDRRDQTPDAPTTVTDDATTSRHLYTMTVDEVAAKLEAYDLHRDTRTIQRWCKSGKLRAITDHQNGDRYLIDPGSVREVVTTLLEERDSRAPRHTTTSRPRHDDAGTPSRHAGDAPTQFEFTPHSLRDKEARVATDDPNATATSDGSRDEVATLKQRIEELEKEKAMLSVDKQVREQMVDYLKDNFQKMLDQALERTEQLGQLQAENAQLRALLPEQPQHQRPSEYGHRGGEGQASEHHESHPHSSPSSMHRRPPWSPE